VGLVGAGAMGAALAAGLVRGRPGLAGGLLVADAHAPTARDAAAALGGRVAAVPEAAAADLVCLAVKPKDVPAALEEAAPALTEGAILLSVVMGWSLDALGARAPACALVRLMPNLAVRQGAGVVAIATRGLAPERQRDVADLLGPLGALVPLPESLFGVATALAGSGPGLLAAIAEALEEGAVGAGMPRREARAMVAGVLASTVALLGDGEDPAALRQRVTSPGGSTAAAIAVLERGAVRAHVADAVRAAAEAAADRSSGGASGG
jgi:pyrroline-5-carboxylate reductase